MSTALQPGQTAHLVTPYRGYSAVELAEKTAGYKWLVRVIGSGAELEVYEDELAAMFSPRS